MQIYRYPQKESWNQLTARAVADYSDKFPVVEEVMQNVRLRGDTAVEEYTSKFDHVLLDKLQVTQEELTRAESQIPPSLALAIQTAAKNIDTFHTSQKLDVHVVETYPGVKCWQRSVPIDKVGLYIPGGSAPLFSTVLMLAIPALIAGCREVILCTPPNSSGNVNPAILYAAQLCNVSKVFKIGGIQAIAAMAFGTASVPKVYKIFGPGNSWVTAAKQYVSLNTCSIDMPAGPSELAVVADSGANPAFVASDLLSQAEHGADSQVVLVTTSETILEKVSAELAVQLEQLPRKEIALAALNHSRMILLSSMNEVLEFINIYAPEHLILQIDNAREIAEKVTNAGSVFIGHYTPESAGDYASGTNHTLPTNGWARSVSGLNLESFCKKISYQEISKEGLQQLGPVIETMAEAELLQAHKNAVTLRLKNSKNSKI
jgi:histidinol dehydrogenase